MDSLEQYQQRAIALMDAFQNYIAGITDHDIIDYNEAVHAQNFVAELKCQLQTLRRDVTFARRDIRANYNANVHNASTHRKDKVRAEKSTALLPYEQLLISIDHARMTISDFSRVLSQTIPRFEQAMENSESESVTVNEFEMAEARVRTMLQERLHKWKIVHRSLETRLAHADHNVGEIAYLRGAIKLLEIVTAEINELSEPEHAQP